MCISKIKSEVTLYNGYGFVEDIGYTIILLAFFISRTKLYRALLGGELSPHAPSIGEEPPEPGSMLSDRFVGEPALGRIRPTFGASSSSCTSTWLIHCY